MFAIMPYWLAWCDLLVKVINSWPFNKPIIVCSLEILLNVYTSGYIFVYQRSHNVYVYLSRNIEFDSTSDFVYFSSIVLFFNSIFQKPTIAITKPLGLHLKSL